MYAGDDAVTVGTTMAVDVSSSAGSENTRYRMVWSPAWALVSVTVPPGSATSANGSARTPVAAASADSGGATGEDVGDAARASTVNVAPAMALGHMPGAWAMARTEKVPASGMLTAPSYSVDDADDGASTDSGVAASADS